MNQVEKIKNVSQLPDWFRKRDYRKQLSDIDWYREIRRRQSLSSLLEKGLNIQEDFIKNPFSELNQEIGDVLEIEIQIVDCHLFNEDETYENIKEMLENELRIYQLSHLDNDENVIKKRKDNYNMTDLLEALDDCLEMDELFGEEDE